MPFNLALFQSEPVAGQQLFIILGVITIATLIALGLRFFVNMFEVITAPGASLSHHGQNDNFFFSIFVVFLGGLIGTFGLLAQQAQLSQAFHTFAETVCNDAALLNTNLNYRDIAANYGIRIMDGNFDIFVSSNLVFFPILMVVLWLLVGTVCFLGAKMLGSHTAYGDFLGSIAYSAFFASIGLGFTSLLIIQGMAAYVQQGGISPGALSIVGLVLLLYALILFFMGIAQGGDLASGPVVGVVIVLIFVLGGIGFGIYYYAKPIWEDFTSQIQSYDPS
jgi:hypothetical protein